MFLYFHHIECFWFCNFCRRLTPKCIDNTDVGAYRPAGSSPVQRRGEAVVPVPQHAAGLLYCGEKFRGLDA
jgi:hypothetical protein